MKSLAAAAAAVAVAALVAWAASDGGVDAAGVPVVAWCALAAFAVNWAAFVPSWILRTELHYDITGTVSYLVVTLLALVLVDRWDPLSLLLSAMVAIWTVRLGTFLLRRILSAGSDSRFDEIKQDPLRLFMTWSIQGLWVFLTLAAVLGALTAQEETSIGWVAVAGTVVWLGGFTLEVVADHQKSVFRSEAANDGRFITSGLWAWSRHPNYFGEITLWVGVTLAAVPALAGWRYVTLISPVFVALLITRVSGVPLLEARARRRWGDDPAWRDYVERTPVLVPRPPRRSPTDGSAAPS